MNKNPIVLWALSVALLALASCGGGGGGGSAGGIGGAASGLNPSGSISNGVAAEPGAFTAGRPSGLASGNGDPSAGGTSGTTTSGENGGTATSGNDATGSTAAGGDDSGVGSGGTGVSTADAVGVGSVDGLGSVIVNGLRYNSDSATVRIEDAAALEIGMSVKVTGPIDADFANGVARVIESAAEFRGPVGQVDVGAGTFGIQGSTVSTDSATVYADVSGLSAIGSGTTVQVWGLPAAPGFLRATRIERRPATALPVVTGTVQALDPARQVFQLGALSVDYGAAWRAGAVDAGVLVNGAIVRVRAVDAPQGTILLASRVQAWNPVVRTEGLRVQLAGVVTDYAALPSLRVLGVPVDAGAARITGGPPTTIGNGVKVEVDGTIANGKLVAATVRIRHVPGTGGPSSFNVIGNIGSFTSSSSFRVRGQPIDASGPGVLFVGGGVGNLRNGVRVNVLGAQIRDGVLLADRVSFE